MTHLNLTQHALVRTLGAHDVASRRYLFIGCAPKHRVILVSSVPHGLSQKGQPLGRSRGPLFLHRGTFDGHCVRVRRCALHIETLQRVTTW